MKKFLLFILVISMFGINAQTGYGQKYENFLKEFTAQVGKNDFTSGNPLDVIPQTYFTFGSQGVARAVFRFHPSCWYDWKLPNGQIDQDIHDCSYKLFGISPFFEANNTNGLMAAARCLPDSFKMELCIYQNVNRAIVVHEPFIQFDLRNVYRLYVQFHKSKTKDRIIPVVWADDAQGNQLWVKEYPSVPYKWKMSKSIFLWHGGRNSDENPYGGPVSQKTTIYAKIMN